MLPIQVLIPCLLAFVASSLFPEFALGFSEVQYHAIPKAVPFVYSRVRREVKTSLLLQNRDDDPHDTSSSEMEASSINLGLVATDLLAVSLACQLLGLLDVLGDSDFWKNGGWFQPIPSAPSSLPTLIQRLSINGITYFGIAVPLGVCGANEPQQGDKPVGSSSFVGSVTRWAPLFVLLRLATTVGLAAMVISTSPDGLEQLLVPAILEGLRECYFVILAVAGGRYIYSLLY